MDVRTARTDEELATALELRARVFCDEQGVTPEADRDGRDDEAVHIVALEDGRVIGTCRLVFRNGTARLGRLAVVPAHRRRGVGAAILAEAGRVARAEGADRVALHAQTYARDLYARAGYVDRGEPFEEEGIAHVAMEKQLA